VNKRKINSIIEAPDISPEDIVFLLSLKDKGDVGFLRNAADDLTTSVLGNKVYYKGIVEFSNICVNNCFYCGIRKNNKVTDRYSLSEEEVIKSALWSATASYGSCVLQSGERHDDNIVCFVEKSISEIKRRSRSELMPDGLGITLSVGEQTPEVYSRFFEARAHRYLMRIETSNPALYAKLHPENMTFENRLASLVSLRKTGFQVGTGVMIGIPGQTIEYLANDILFFNHHDIDMIGMGPYIMHLSGTIV
jgi:biotin synthase